jgi:hypothetical protein
MDRAWGAVLGLIFVAFIGGSFLVGHISGANAGGCDKALAALPGGTTVSADAFNAEDASLAQVIDFLNEGDSTSADNTFYGPVHSFMHNADPPIRLANENLARNLCETVVQLETDLAAGSKVTTYKLADDTTKVRDALREGAVALGYPRPGS